MNPLAGSCGCGCGCGPASGARLPGAHPVAGAWGPWPAGGRFGGPSFLHVAGHRRHPSPVVSSPGGRGRARSLSAASLPPGRGREHVVCAGAPSSPGSGRRLLWPRGCRWTVGTRGRARARGSRPGPLCPLLVAVIPSFCCIFLLILNPDSPPSLLARGEVVGRSNLLTCGLGVIQIFCPGDHGICGHGQSVPSLPTCVPLISFSYLTASAGTSGWCWKAVGGGHLFLLILEEKCQVSHR